MTTTYATPPTTAQYLDDGGSAYTTTSEGTYGGVARVYDTGAGPVLWNGFAVINVTALTTGGGRTYTVKIRLSNSATFASGVVDRMPFTVAAVDEYAAPISNEVAGTIYRYVEIQFIPAGTSPSIKAEAWLLDQTDIDALSPAALTNFMGLIVDRFNQAREEWQLWAFGVTTGGPGSDGKYPLSNGMGSSDLFDCPALMAANASAGLSTASISGQAAQTTYVPLDPTTPDAEPVLVGLMGPTGSQVIKKFGAHLISSRRTQDLHRWTDANDERSIGNLMLQMMEPTSKLDYQITAAELMRVTTGVIDPTKSPYNCKFDAGHARYCSATNGSPVLVAPEPTWRASDAGKELYVSNIGTSGLPQATSIVSVTDSTHIVMADNAQSDQPYVDAIWGTDDTVGMQAALDDAEAYSTFTYGGVVKIPSGSVALVGSLKIRPRSALFGTGVRQSGFIRKPDGVNYTTEFAGSQPAPTIWNESRDADFVAMGDFAINGARFVSIPGCPGLVYWTRTGGETMAQVDPYPMFTRMHIHDTGWDGVEFRNRHSGTFAMVEIVNCGGSGLNVACYDANIINILSIAHQGPGLFVQGQGANNNFINNKISFSGVNMQWLLGAWLGAGNVLVEGAGNNFENMRVQESFGSNVIVSGQGNNFTGTQADDTGCIFPVHGFTDGSLPAVRAAILVVAGAQFNRFNDFGYGPAVHLGSNYATHGIYFAGDGNSAHDPVHTQGRVFTKGMTGLSYYGSGTGDFTPGAVGSTALGAGSIDASNSELAIDGTPVA